MNYPRLALLLSIAVLLSACGTSAPDDPGPLTPMPNETAAEPSDAAIKVAVDQFLANEHAPAASVYDFTRFDLDGDARRDALVLFKNPYGYWCNDNGCGMLVLHANREDFTIVNEVHSVRGPVYVSTENTNGWRDLMMRISGRWSQTKDVALQYDGTQYPAQPDMQPAYDRLAQCTASKMFR